MQGAGNDFVVLDGVSRNPALTPSQLRRLADRHFGVGCDQILLVEAPRAAGTDFRYRIFNADGGEVEQCGNGARCFVRFVRERGLTDKSEIRVETAAAASARGYTSAARARRSLAERAPAPRWWWAYAAACSMRARVSTRGGDLTIGWEGADNPVWLTGPAVTVFEGEMEIDES